MENQSGESSKICVIDDDRGILELLSLAIEDVGYKVAAENLRAFKLNPESYTTFLKLNHSWLVICDIPIPYQENWQFIQKLRNSPESSKLPFLYTTTNINCLEKFIGDLDLNTLLLGKPFDLDDLLATINKASRINKHQ